MPGAMALDASAENRSGAAPAKLGVTHKSEEKKTAMPIAAKRLRGMGWSRLGIDMA